MREQLLESIHCPICQATRFSLEAAQRDEREIREGIVVCLNCGAQLPIANGILNLLPNPSAVIQSEQRGWVEMLGEAQEQWVETMLELPYFNDGIWQTVARNFDQVLEKIEVGGKRILDLGAGRCWSSRRLAQAGAQSVLALDILSTRFIGLETADIFLQNGDPYFERVLGDMNDLPLQATQFDLVFVTGSLHHSSDIKNVFRQISRVLAPGGSAVIINEPVKSLLWPHDLSVSDEYKHGINENAYTIPAYLSAVRGAGLKPQLFFPRSIEYNLEHNRTNVWQEFGHKSYMLLLPLHRYRRGRQFLRGSGLLLALCIANMPLTMIATKTH